MSDHPDSLGMADLIAGLPEQATAALAQTGELTGLPEHDEIENVLVIGMGGSGVVGDVLTVAAGPFMAVPVVVHKGYSLPNFVDRHTLVVAVSCSGNTEETLEAASAAAMAGGRMLVVTQGGALADLATEWQAPWIRVDPTIPMPRAAVAAMTIPPLVVFEQLGLFPGAVAWVEAAIAQLRARRDELVASDNPAAALARRIGRQIPLIYGGSGLGDVAARRWKTQCNENAKIPAFANTYPELCHNEICGWGQHGDVTRQVFRVVTLRHDFEHPQIARRIAFVDEVLREVTSGQDEVVAAGDGTLAQLLDLMYIGDFVSLHLALNEGVDPGPVAVLDELKAALAASG
ncbi:MAG: bifunctional phosphoglucose/phosphomannose isomerase [Acidimicrobiia bacterium]|nr:bifunctional phosphoglucose/phosphomannose isomerase [Acidimicrobiia bacterium]